MEKPNILGIREFPWAFHGDSMKANRLRRDLVKWARSNHPIIIRGEEGSKHSHASWLLHSLAWRRGRDWQSFDFAAISGLDAQLALFGCLSDERQLSGLLDSATRGTLILANVHAAEPDLLAEVARRVTSRAGFEARVIATMTASAHQACPPVLQGFASLDLPPLRIRTEDAPAIARELLADFDPSNPLGLSEEASRVLAEYSWPGNMAELEDVLFQASFHAKSRTIGIDDLPIRIVEASGPPSSGLLPTRRPSAFLQSNAGSLPRSSVH